MQNSLIHQCRKYMTLSKTGIQIIRAETSEVTCFHKFSTPKLIEEESRKNGFKLLEKYGSLANNQMILFKDRLKMSYLISIITAGETDRYLVSLGPFMDEDIKNEDIKYLGHIMKLSIENIPILQNYYGKLPLMNHEEIADIADIFNSVLKNDVVETERIEDITRTKLPKENRFSNKFDQYDFVEQNYQSENMLLKAIESGNVETVTPFMDIKNNMVSIPSRNKYDSLRDTKNIVITLNSISARAAIKGGLNLHLAHSISTKYAIAIENHTSVDGVLKLASELIREYTQSVRDYSLKKYTPLIKQALIIIRKNITMPVTLKTIAAKLHTSSEHLSREFKKELGKNITNYINELKIKESVDLIESKKYSISDIAFIFGYSSSSYYSTVFKKVMGMSPADCQRR